VRICVSAPEPCLRLSSAPLLLSRLPLALSLPVPFAQRI
jgi:hypothetical protein